MSNLLDAIFAQHIRIANLLAQGEVTQAQQVQILMVCIEALSYCQLFVQLLRTSYDSPLA
jgi:hypothetical protein